MSERLPMSDPAVQQALGRRKSKYGAIKVELDGYVFDSKREAARYAELKILQALKLIYGLEVHPRFQLDVNGVRIAEYVGDFLHYQSLTERMTVEDVKSAPTRKLASYRIKVKLLKALHGIDVLEII